MTIDRKLLEILVCPVTKQRVSVLPENRLQSLNNKIAAGEVKDQAGDPVTEALAEALMTDNGSVIYPVESSIPIMLEGRSIATVQLGDW